MNATESSCVLCCEILFLSRNTYTKFPTKMNSGFCRTTRNLQNQWCCHMGLAKQRGRIQWQVPIRLIRVCSTIVTEQVSQQTVFHKLFMKFSIHMSSVILYMSSVVFHWYKRIVFLHGQANWNLAKKKDTLGDILDDKSRSGPNRLKKRSHAFNKHDTVFNVKYASLGIQRRPISQTLKNLRNAYHLKWLCPP